jgi:O-methyltransferase
VIVVKLAQMSASFAYPSRPAPENLLTTHPDMESDFVAAYAAALAATMTSPERMYALWQAARHVVATRVPGALVECGVWRGGSAMVMAQALLAEGRADRELWLYDTFAGMPDPSALDVDFMGVAGAERLAAAGSDREDLVVAYASLSEVQANIASVGYPAERVVYVEGRVEETIPGRAPSEIALLRLDTDWESSTRHELEHLWPRVAVGGVVIIDDYGHWSGAHRAVDEYFAGRSDAPLLARIDYTGRVGVRVRESSVDA